MGKSKEIDGIQYRWNIIGDSRKAISITRAVFEAAGSVGVNATTFKFGVGEKWFTEGDVILFDSPEYKARVMAEPYYDGNDYILTCQLVTADVTKSIPAVLVAVGKEVSKESYIFAGLAASDIKSINNEGFNLFEQTGVLKNFFGLESKYFEFDKSFSKIFKSISTSDIAGITQNLNIEQVLAKFPYNKYSGSSGSSTNKGDDFQLGFYVASTKNESATSSGATVDSSVATDAYDSNNQPASTIVDKYPFLSEYNSTYYTYANFGNNLSITYNFNFDQSLKTAVFGWCPMATKKPVQGISDSCWVALLKTFTPVTSWPSPRTSSVSVLYKISMFCVF
jgi:hypothetical protein